MAQIATTTHSLSGLRGSLPIIVALIAYATVLAKGSGVLDDQDPYLHVAVGRWIIAHGDVPHRDVFSHSMPGAPWVPHEWLAEVVLAWLYDHFGWPGLVVATALSFAAALGLMARALLRYLEPGYALIGVMTAWGMCFPHLLARPHILSFPLLVAWAAALVAARSDDRAPPSYVALLMVPWANLHGGYMFGLALVALFAGEAVFDAPDRRRALRAVGAWSMFGVLSLLAALATPNGIAGLLLPLDLIRMDFALSWVNEWQSPNFQKLQPIEAWLLLALLGALLFGIRLPITRIAMLLVLVHMALKHQRHGEILGLVAPLLVAPMLAPQLPQLTKGFAVAPFNRASGGLAKWPSANAVVLAAALVLAAVITWLRVGVANTADRFTPAAALAAVAQHRVAGAVFNDYNFGGYLIFSGIPPFIDGRADMYGDDFIKRLNKPEEWDRLFAQYGVTWTLLAAGNPHVVLLDHLPGWRRLYADTIAVVHVRENAGAAR
jgi:hypothetical protein